MLNIEWRKSNIECQIMKLSSLRHSLFLAHYSLFTGFLFSKRQTPDQGNGRFGPGGSGICAKVFNSPESLFRPSAVCNLDLDSRCFHPRRSKNSSPSSGAN